MTIQEILNSTEHRPWKMPKESWKFYQEWNNVIFLHWQVDLTELQKFVPKELEIELIDGKPWVSVVAFTMEKIRPKGLPPLPPISDFDEINIRTYVKSNNKTGVYFLSIEGGNSLSCKVARRISELPYRYSKIERNKNQYQSKNIGLKDRLNIVFSIGENVTGKTLVDKWLTERYALFQETEKSINEFEIHHLEWPIQEINIEKLDFDYPRFKNLIKNSPDRTQYSQGVQVVAWGKNKREKSGYNNANN